MSAVAVENLLALLYTNPHVRKTFEATPARMLAGLDLTDDEKASLLDMDWPGLTLAGNGFGYKRWKSNLWRHAEAYMFAAYDGVFPAEVIAAVRDLFEGRMAKGLFSTDRAWAPRQGLVSELLKVKPENQINHEHVLLENDKLAPVTAVWHRLGALNLHHHYLIRAYFHRVTVASCGKPDVLHRRPGACITYIPLADQDTPGAFATARMRDGTTIARVPLRAGGSITFPADVDQGIVIDREVDTSSSPIDMLCIKTLCAAV